MENKLKKSLIAYLFILPAMIFLVIFVFYPIVASIPLAFYNYSVLGQSKYVGWANFTRALHDHVFWISVENSLLFVGVVPPLQVLSIILAILVNRKIRGISFFRALYYIPVVTSMVAVSITWGWIFDPQGLLNSFMISHGIFSKPISFLNDPRFALLSLMFITLWQGLGYYMMIYLAGLQSIPKELEESAYVDGATKTQVLFRITIPLLKPYIWLCTFMSVLSAVRVFDVVYVLTNGGPGNATMVTSLYSFQKAFTNFDFGYSSAIGLLVAILTTTLSILVFMYGGRKGGMSYY
ncbi:lactose ABC transporter permease [Thermoanaerobacterium thermosaccharolyticum]|uniref:carbohydrate ABC transporter permease n=1 Tax=Thermoanaerobacterium thermosaccharolyticum TaxID=1517 RepID=UPI000C072BCC|nr:sugar ABC transporter permease [Thermoanaerobacterium thermosaccharolyticum]PHO08525.1 lactose ABC transporter permease [Thermoanaerobacterium thermosaccharolyticum]